MNDSFDWKKLQLPINPPDLIYITTQHMSKSSSSTAEDKPKTHLTHIKYSSRQRCYCGFTSWRILKDTRLMNTDLNCVLTLCTFTINVRQLGVLRACNSF